ncbi:MAG: alpha/beta hydrolase, partial [Anaerolineae bacterium]|nr:alpha/beta hydrolase [Anaerolineae bacterium]
NPQNADSDGDSISDRIEIDQGTMASLDTDNDAAPDALEILAGTDPLIPDSDGDGTSDGKQTGVLDDEPVQVFASSTHTVGSIATVGTFDHMSIFVKKKIPGAKYYLSEFPDRVSMPTVDDQVKIDGAAAPVYNWYDDYSLFAKYAPNPALNPDYHAERNVLLTDSEITDMVPETGIMLIEAVDRAAGNGNNAYGLSNIYIVPVIPPTVKIAVDANRDGEIDIDGDSDKTTEQKPFRFWCNDDRDVLFDGEEQDVDNQSGAGTKDSDQDEFGQDSIECNRDLEDFTGLAIKIDLAQLPTDATIELKANGLGVNIFQGTWTDTLGYLSNENRASMQRFASHIARLESGQSRPISRDLFHNDIAKLVFEGITPSTSEDSSIEVIIKTKAGNPITSSKTFIRLKTITNFYEHYSAGPSDQEGAAILNPAVAMTPLDYSKDPGLSTTDDYILFVHGWRMQPWERRRFAETAFKRLYLQGYEGKVGFFSWPTEWVDYDTSRLVKTINAIGDLQHYDRCEVQARKSGLPLHNLLLDLRKQFGSDHIHVFAHSMGNVVLSEALRLHPKDDKLVESYASCQS